MKSSANTNELVNELKLGLGSSVAVKYQDTTTSTNTLVKELFNDGLDASTLVLFTFNQTSGRGTRGRVWQCQPGQDIALSIGQLRGANAVIDPRYSLAVGQCAAQEIENALSIPIKVKWPNDLMVRHPAFPTEYHKTGGILVESTEISGRGKLLVTGIGINVNSQNTEYSADIRDTACSLRDVLGKTIDINQLTVSIANALCLFLRFYDDDELARWIAAWQQQDTTKGTRYRLNDENQTKVIAIGIDDKTGGLIVETLKGQQIVITSYTELTRI